MEKKKVLIHSIVFNPDGVSTGYLYGDIATALRDAGNEVVVLTTTPHYNRVEAQLDKQPLKWKIRGLLKKSCYKGTYGIPCASEEIQIHATSLSRFCVLAYYFFYLCSIYQEFRCNSVAITTPYHWLD